MRNVFSARLSVHTKYDLKGSTVDREASEKEREKPLPTLKDNDFIKEGCKISIGEQAKEKLITTLHADVDVGGELLRFIFIFINYHNIFLDDSSSRNYI